MALQLDLLDKAAGSYDEEEEEKEEAAASASDSIIEANLSGSGSSGSGSSSSDDSLPSVSDKEEEEEEPEEEKPLPELPKKPSQIKAENPINPHLPQVVKQTDLNLQLYKIRSQKWYEGEEPTEVEILAQIARIGELDYHEGKLLADKYLKLKETGYFKETYDKPTSQWLGELGIKPEELNDETIAGFQAFIREYGTTTANGQLSSAKKYGKNSVLAYKLDQVCNDYFKTQGLLGEQDALKKEISYWIAQGYTDAEIKKKLNLSGNSAYKGLYNAMELTKNGEYEPTTAAITAATSYGLDALIYETRNGKSSGSAINDAVFGMLGRGAKPTATPEEIARRTPGDKAWAPYATSLTMHDEAMLFGVTSFDQKWLDENYARIAASGDQKLIDAYGRVADAVAFTEKAQKEAADLKKFVAEKLAGGKNPATVFTDDLLEQFGGEALQDLYNGQKKLNLVDTTAPIDFDLYGLRAEAEKAYKEYKGTVSSKEYEQQLNESLGLNQPVDEGQEALDKQAEEDLEQWRETLEYNNPTPAENEAARIAKPEVYRVAASTTTGISAGTGGYENAYLSSIQNANDYAGANYLNAKTTLETAQSELDDLNNFVYGIVDKWFPGMDREEAIRKLANEEVPEITDPQFTHDLAELYNAGGIDGYLKKRSELSATIANERAILDSIVTRFAEAEELNTTGKPSQSVMPMLEYMDQFNGSYNPKVDYAAYGDWQFGFELGKADWEVVKGELNQRTANNNASIEELDLAIKQAEKWGISSTYIDNMRRAKDILELDNKLTGYALLRDSEGFQKAVEKFNSEEKAGLFSFGKKDAVHDSIINFDKWKAKGLRDSNYMPDNKLASYVYLMTDAERDTYKYLYETQGKDAAAEYFDLLSGTYMDNRKASYEQMEAERLTKEHPIAMNALSVLGSPLKAMGVVEVVRAAVTGDDIDPNSEFFRVGRIVSEVRDTTTEMITEHYGEGTTANKIAQFGYQIATSICDSLAAAATGGGAVVMGIEAFADTAWEATLRGGDKWDVILYAGVTGLAETATEYLPMGAIEDAFKRGGKAGVQNFLADLLKSGVSGLSEAPGEALSELISQSADAYFMEELSQYAGNIAAYQQQGYSPEEAEKLAKQDFWKNVGMAAVQGFVAGSGQTTISYVGGRALRGMKNIGKNEAPQQTVETAPVEDETAPVQQESTPSAPFEYTPPAPQQALEKKAPKNIRMVTSLANAQKQGVGEAARAGTILGVMTSGGLSEDLALAAAKNLSRNMPVVQKLQSALQKASESEAMTVLKAFAYRSLVGDSRLSTMSDADVVSTVENDPKLANELDTAVLNSEIATEEMKVLSEMDKGPVTAAKRNVDQKHTKLKQARTRYNMAGERVNTARKGMQQLNAEFRADPGNGVLAKRVQEAAKEVAELQKQAEAEKLNVEVADKAHTDAKNAQKELYKQRTNEARLTARDRVLKKRAEMKQLAEQAAVEAQQKATEQAAPEVQQPVAEDVEAVDSAAEETIAEEETPSEPVAEENEWQKENRERREKIIEGAKSGKHGDILALTDAERSSIRPDLEGVWAEKEKKRREYKTLQTRKNTRGLTEAEFNQMLRAQNEYKTLYNEYMEAWKNPDLVPSIAAPVQSVDGEPTSEMLDKEDVIAQEVERMRAEMQEENAEWREQYKAKVAELEKRRKYRSQIMKGTKDIVKLLARPTKKKHVIAGLDQAVTDFLGSLDLGTRSKTAIKIGDAIQNLVDVFNNHKEETGISIDPELMDSMLTIVREARGFEKDGNPVTVGRLDTDQMRDLNNMVKSVKHIINNSNKMFASKRNATVSDIAGRTMSWLDTKKDSKKREGMFKAVSDMLNDGMLDSFHFWDNLGTAAKEVFNEVRDGFDQKARHIREGINHANTVAETLSQEILQGKDAPKILFKLENGTVELTKAQVMELYCLSGRQQAISHILNGGIRTAESPAVVKVTQRDLDTMIGTLTAEEKAAAQSLQRFMATECSAWGNEASLNLYGYRKFTEPDYYPIHVDPNSVKTHQSEGADNASLYAVQNMGITKEVKKGSINALMIGDIFDTFSSHVDSMSTYNAYAAPITDVLQWYNYKDDNGSSMKTVLEQKVGNGGKDYITTFIRDLSGQTGRSYSPGISETLARNAKIASIGNNLRVVVQQPTAIARAALLMNPKYIVRGVTATPAQFRQASALARKYSPIADWKSMGFYETNIGQPLRDMMFEGGKSLRDKAVESSMKWAGKMDEFTFAALWRACEAEVRSKNPDMTGDNFHEAVGKRLSEVIDYTQVVDSPLHRTQIMRSKNWAAQTATAFMSEPSKTYNMLYSALHAAEADPNSKTATIKLSRAMAVYAGAAILNAVAQSAWDGVRDEDEDKYLKNVMDAFLGDFDKAETFGDYAKAFMSGNLAGGLNPIGIIPFVKDIASMMQGYEPSRMDMQGVEKAIRVINEVPKLFKGKSQWNGLQWIRSIASALSYAFGIPVENGIRDGVAIWNTAASFLGYDKIKAETKKPGAAEIGRDMYSDMMSGDKRGWDKAEDGLKNGSKPKNNSEIDIQVAAAMSDADDRTAQAWGAIARGDATGAELIRTELVEDILRAGVVTDPVRATEIVDKAINGHRPTEEKPHDPEKQLNAKLYETKDVFNMLAGMAGITDGDATQEDLELVISELVADSTAKNPQKQTMTNIKNAVKDEYIELYRKTGSTKELKNLHDLLIDVIGVSYKTILDWQAQADED